MALSRRGVLEGIGYGRRPGLSAGFLKENVEQAIGPFRDPEDRVPFFFGRSRNIGHRLSRIKDDLKHLSSIHGFQSELCLDEIERTLDAPEIQNLARD
jgi:hypothetical protein